MSQWPLQIDDAFRRQDTTGDGEIETGPLFFDVCRGKIDCHPVSWKAIAGILYSGLNPVLAFPDSRIGQADGRELGKAGGYVNLDIDGIGIYSYY